MRFEWDEHKNAVNLAKHGFDFADAFRLFESPLLTALDEREDYGESRIIGLGLLNGRTVVIVFTEPDDETIRMISMRKALSQEQRRYEQYLKNELGAD